MIRCKFFFLFIGREPTTWPEGAQATTTATAAKTAVKKCIERFHSRGQHLCKFNGTKESVCIRKEFNSHRTGLEHQDGRRFIVLGHQYGRRDVMWKHSFEFNSSAPLFLATLSSPPRTFSLLNIQEGCTLNKGLLNNKGKGVNHEIRTNITWLFCFCWTW